MLFHLMQCMGYLQLGLFCLPVQVLGLVLLQGVLQLMLGLPTASLCSLQFPKQLCTPATQVDVVFVVVVAVVVSMSKLGIGHDWRLPKLQLVHRSLSLCLYKCVL